MLKLDARKSGSFEIGGDIEAHRLGFGAMRITGPRIWGSPLDRAEAIRTLKRLPELGIDFIDAADSYGPNVSEQLIREALYPYDGILIATKAGLTRPGPGEWERMDARTTCANKLSKAATGSGSSRSDCGSYRASIRKCRANEQFAVVKSLQDDAIIRHARMSA
jgi:pyridoxine 4-dehydrogenase